LLAPVSKLAAEHHLTNADPLMVDFHLQSLEGRYTSVEDFYIRDHGPVPSLPGTNVLEIEGEVENPRRISIDELQSLPTRDLGAILECAGNTVGTLGKVSNGVWKGWTLTDVLALAQPTRPAAFLHLFGRDGCARCVPIDHASSDTMLATHLNGRRLDRHHGTPWRALFPGWYGMDCVKWLERIVVSKAALPSNDNAYLELVEGPSGEIIQQPLPQIQVKSVILDTAQGSVLRRGRMKVHGLAWSGQGKITSVEVKCEKDPAWHPATLDTTLRYEWARWRCELEISQPGAAEIAC
jgi:DMSO/TMAO reductase YedYZ molybdopterin-dependent catalytic subunit